MRACVIASLLAAQWAALAPCALATPGFRHIVIVVQENRTPDNLFGSNPTFEPNVDIATSGVNSQGQVIPLTAVPLASCYDIAHAHVSFEAMLLQGADQEEVKPNKNCQVPANPQFKFVDNSAGAVQPYFDIASGYGFANRMFQTNQGPSFPAHQFLFGGTSAPGIDTPLFAAENMANTKQNAGCIGPVGTNGQRVAIIAPDGSETEHKALYPCFDHPTLSDLLETAPTPLSWRYYAPEPGSIWTAPDAISHICKPEGHGAARACTGADWLANVVPDNPAQVLSDIAACNLPAVSWVIPNGEESDHALLNKGLGPQWVASIVNAVGAQSCANEGGYWNDTAILITWDDWGGWYDHVTPFSINQPPVWGAGYTYGFRVPLLVVSAYTPAGFVDNTVLDVGNILYFVEQNFGLGFIGPGQGRYSNYADYHAASRGALGEFFTLNAARSFVPISARLDARYFINAPKSHTPPDDD
jgi:phospholipase C